VRRLPFILFLAFWCWSPFLSARAQPAPHLRPSGNYFQNANGTPFQWRGITAFRLVEMVAHGRAAEARAYLDWAADRKLTVVRVFTMAHGLFELAPEEGVRALPELLQMAASRGLHVEIVALADTAVLRTNMEAHVKAIGAIASRNANALVELANEPAHRTQAPALHDPRELQRLASFIPADVPVSLGSAEENDAFASGRYATYHFPRSAGPSPWGHVAGLAKGAAMIKRWGKPVVNDEPIGAAATPIPGRRDNDPDRFRAIALLSRLAGIGATFHYEQGLQARIPDGVERRCFDAWNEAWTLLPGDIEVKGTFHQSGEPDALVTAFTPGSAVAVVDRVLGNIGYVLALDVRDDPGLRWRAGWRIQHTQRLGNIQLSRAVRR
jgi:hypothetical protein